MGSLQVPLDTFRTQHAAVERKVLPRLEADDLVVPDLQLNSTLLAAKTAMRLHKPLGFYAGQQAHTRHGRPARPELLRDLQVIDRNRSHVVSTTGIPQRALRQAEQRATASRADLLVVLDGGCATHFVGEPKLTFDRREIAHHRCRCVGLATSAALRLLTAAAGILVEA